MVGFRICRKMTQKIYSIKIKILEYDVYEHGKWNPNIVIETEIDLDSKDEAFREYTRITDGLPRKPPQR